ncbi:Dabb family protein [Streptomyces sp. NP160]|uniref:Dabb family protein n=1 Tax=Streptomyces sp. NP160 TaxID=2586637 RepID=UPI00111B7949|nr:Dabb family protein [Streptomyces sp. NP160]TNM64152.1 Dabb family protein [Streptomyces sp. NP160]
MIRNVVVGKLREGVDLAEVQPGLDAIAALDSPGCLARRVGTDLRLREQPWDFAITNDWADEASYRAYDLDEEHNRIRRELFAPLCEQIVRVQFEVPDSP